MALMLAGTDAPNKSEATRSGKLKLVGPPMVAGLFVGLFLTLVGDRVGTFLKDQSVSSKRAAVRRPAYMLGPTQTDSADALCRVSPTAITPV
jgi:hypothetical protein